ncbi:methionine sulfoxide reductase A [Haladaptatus paucihalophilus DX253]|uniref:Peptide methionine sulfoxide reductase MsrA n=1 Tax=Haladaptatus paucihalophilus DX253 TaxID=797209 RepID=E7QX33_HALPU|nr:peptide-methionine (S)-S-oxide reductase MsrA [Haladaptatus paucihalophilus]EFW90836.1 methionine sulfoxide reductase A [Haladaptatus paucihalophilus DX253]SHK23496.1 peptide-methionine (S)-S-oxide reductase [Haladaptatus paucihalophilus DX253]
MTETATLAGGCFWCLEAAYKELDGVQSVTSGYAGGSVENPTYEAVCSGETGHAEVVQLEYNPETVGYDELLQVFFTIHDPTTLNRQGPDVGTQYRSAIFYHDDDQKEVAEAYIDGLESEGAFEDPIVTDVEPLSEFYEAEGYHQDYYEKNPNDAYCTMNAQPKIRKVREKFVGKANQ